MRHFQVERLCRLPQRSDETWQGGFVRLPGWVQEKDEKPYRAVAPVWVSTRTGAAHLGEAPGSKNEVDEQHALDALSDFAADEHLCGYRPARIEVNNADLAAYLAEMLVDAQIAVAHTPTLERLDKFMAELAKEAMQEPPELAALRAKGVTVERLRAFADAAARFYLSQPWTHFLNDDLIEIVAPRPVNPAMRHVVVLGAAGIERGLGFLASIDDYWRLIDHPGDRTMIERGLWNCYYGDMTQLPYADADAWEDYDLPVAGERAYPIPGFFRAEGMRRPNADELAFLEAVLRAIAESSELEFETGRWTKTVATCDGPRALTLALPFLFDVPKPADLLRRNLIDVRVHERARVQFQRFREEHPTLSDDAASVAYLRGFDPLMLAAASAPAPRNRREEAQELCYDAFQSFGLRRTTFARKALSIDPDCADAYVLLAERSPSREKALEFYLRGVAAGRRALEPHAASRPFMRALMGLATTQMGVGDLEPAIATFQELLRLDPADSRGARLYLLPSLMGTDRDKEALALLGAFPNDRHALSDYCRALLLFRAGGDSTEARDALAAALTHNAFVPKFLVGEVPADCRADLYEPGSREEAAMCADACGHTWDRTPGALAWLVGRTKKCAAKPRGAPRRGKKT
jgi:tetratricopeptide (TPR) repeat protein